MWPKLESRDETERQHSITLRGTRAVWGLQGQYLLLWGTDESQRSTISVYRTEDLCHSQKTDPPEPLRTRTLSPGEFGYGARILEPCSESDEGFEVLIAERDAKGKRRVFIWDVNKNIIRNELTIPTEKETRLIKTHPTFEGRPTDNGIKGSQFDLDEVFYKLRVIEAVYPKFCISKNRQWLGTCSKKFQSCSIASVKSGATVWCSGFAQPLQVGPFGMPIEATFDPNGDHFLIMGECAIMVCAPDFLDDKACAEECDQSFLEAYACLPSQSLANALQDREYDCGVPSWIMDVSYCIDDDSLMWDATQSGDRKRLAFTVPPQRRTGFFASIFSVDSCRGLPSRILVKRPPAENRYYRTLLSLDGGGLRLHMTNQILKRLEWHIREHYFLHRELLPETAKHVTSPDQIEVQLADHFDLVSGVSGGSWLALYYASKGGNGASAKVFNQKYIIRKYGHLYPGCAKGIDVFFEVLGKKIYPPLGICHIPKPKLSLRGFCGYSWSHSSFLSSLGSGEDIETVLRRHEAQ